MKRESAHYHPRLDSLPPSWKPFARDFAVYLLSERVGSWHTLMAYQRDVIHFIRFVAQQRARQRPSDLQRDDVTAWLLLLQADGYATASRARFLIGVKVFLKFLRREGCLPNDFKLTFHTPHIEQKVPSYLTSQELERLFAVCAGEEQRQRRDRAILELLYSSGLRVSELCSLNVDDVYDTYLRVMGKGGKQRQVPLGRFAIAAVDAYLSCRNDAAGETHPLLLDDHGRRIDRRFVWKLVKECCKAASITKNVSPHTLRHTYATHLLERGAEVRIVQELLGHAKIDSTNRYLHVTKNRLRDAFAQFHPHP